MKKTSKIIMLLVIVTIISFIFVNSVKAADVIDLGSIDEDGYEEIETEYDTTTENDKSEEDKTEETEKTPEVIEGEDDKKEDAKEDNKEETGKGTADTNHAQTGEFSSAIFVTLIGAGIITMCIAYKKNKKYNF